jgi:ABC-type transport system involved in multi-copper enzyme maturation permease subunit
MTTATSPSTTAPSPSPEPSTAIARPRGRVLPAVVVSEWTKIRSVRSTVWSLVATFGITVGLGALFCFAYVRRYDHLGVRERLTFDPTLQSLRGLFLAQIAIGVLGVLVISAEYATGLIRTTLTAVPQRRTLLAAKGLVFGAVAAVVSVISALGAFFVGQAVLDRKHLGVSLGDPHVLRAVLGAGVYLLVIGLLGLAIGAIVRRTAGAIATLFAVVLVLPLLSNALPSPWSTDIGKFLPAQLGAALFRVRPDSDLLSPGAALVVAVVWLAVFFAVATFLITKRDA